MPVQGLTQHCASWPFAHDLHNANFNICSTNLYSFILSISSQAVLQYFQYVYVEVRYFILSNQISACVCCHVKLICPEPSESAVLADVP